MMYKRNMIHCIKHTEVHNNEMFKNNNELLEKKTVQLEGLVKELRKETRGIWWNGLLDKWCLPEVLE